jgi:hypothetical protein
MELIKHWPVYILVFLQLPQQIPAIMNLVTPLNIYKSRTETLTLKPVQRISGKENVRELKNGVFWDVTPCGSFKNQRFGET